MHEKMRKFNSALERLRDSFQVEVIEIDRVVSLVTVANIDIVLPESVSSLLGIVAFRGIFHHPGIVGMRHFLITEAGIIRCTDLAHHPWPFFPDRVQQTKSGDSSGWLL